MYLALVHKLETHCKCRNKPTSIGCNLQIEHIFDKNPSSWNADQRRRETELGIAARRD